MRSHDFGGVALQSAASTPSRQPISGSSVRIATTTGQLSGAAAMLSLTLGGVAAFGGTTESGAFRFSFPAGVVSPRYGDAVLHPLAGSIATMPAFDAKWEHYLDDLAARRGMHAAVAAVKRLWAELRMLVGRPLATPMTVPTDEGTIQLAWDTGAEYLDIDVSPAGILWFYRNRVTSFATGSDDVPVTEVPKKLAASLRSVA